MTAAHAKVSPGYRGPGLTTRTGVQVERTHAAPSTPALPAATSPRGGQGTQPRPGVKEGNAGPGSTRAVPTGNAQAGTGPGSARPAAPNSTCSRR